MLVYLFGSRAKGTACIGSDVGLAVIASDEPDYPALAFAIIEKDRLRDSLAPLLPYLLDLQFAFADDMVVMPAVIEHGILIYGQIDEARTNFAKL